MLAGPLSALIGGAIGHFIDHRSKEPAEEKRAKLMYYAYFFSSAAKVAKANGRISEMEILKVENLIQKMTLAPNLEKFAKDIFRKSKVNSRHISEDFKECAKLVRHEQSIAYSFMGGLFEIATCDGVPSSKAQIKCLLLGEKYFKMPPGTIRSWYAGGYITAPPSKAGNQLKECFDILGVCPTAKHEVIKKYYRKKISSFHPDLLESKNLPEELIILAKEQVIRVNLAYEKIKEVRGFK
jgi:DnaJ like chaperone protein